MKLWEITHRMEDKSYMTEYVHGDTKMEARGVLVRKYGRQLDLVSVKEVDEVKK